MTTLTEGKHAGGFLVWEVLRDYTRETITIASGAGKLEPGTVLAPHFVPESSRLPKGQEEPTCRTVEDGGCGREGSPVGVMSARRTKVQAHDGLVLSGVLPNPSSRLRPQRRSGPQG